MRNTNETQNSRLNRTGSQVDIARLLTMPPDAQADSFMSDQLTSGQRRDLLSHLSPDVKSKILSKNLQNKAWGTSPWLSPQGEVEIFESFTDDETDELGNRGVAVLSLLTPDAKDLVEKRILAAEQRRRAKSTSQRVGEVIIGKKLLGTLTRVTAVAAAMFGIRAVNSANQEAKLKEFQRMCALQFHVQNIDCVDFPQYHEKPTLVVSPTLTPTSAPKQEMTATVAVSVPSKPTEDTIEAWEAYRQAVLAAEKQAGEEHQTDRQELLKARNDEALANISRLLLAETATAAFQEPQATATVPPVLVIETSTPTMTATEAAVEPTLTATISADTLASAYEWAWKQKLGHLENGVLVLNADEFRIVLTSWLTSKGASESEKRANIDIEMLSKPFGEKGMSLSHALDFWKREGGRGWNPEDASHVFSFDELNTTKHEDVFSSRNGENRLGLLVRAQDVKTAVVRMLTERQLRISNMQNASNEEILNFLDKTDVDKGIRQQASGLLRTVGVTVSANKLPSASESFTLRDKNKMPAFALRITRGGKAVNRDLQPETAECVVYLDGLEKTTANNDETMRKSDLTGEILITFTESNNRVVLDVIRFTNIQDVLATGRIQPLADGQSGQSGEIDGGRWIDGCFVAGPGNKSAPGLDATPGIPTATKPGVTMTPGGPTETPGIKTSTPLPTNAPDSVSTLPAVATNAPVSTLAPTPEPTQGTNNGNPTAHPASPGDELSTPMGQ